MNCPKCKLPVDDNAQFCEECGAILTPPDETAVDQIFAPTEMLKVDIEPDKIPMFEPELFNPQPVVPTDLSFQNVAQPAPKMPSGKRTIIIIAVAVVAVVCVGVAAFLGLQSKKQNQVYLEQITKGKEFAVDEKYTDAIATYNEAIALKPKKEEAYIALTDIYIEMNEPKKAEKILISATKQIPKSTVISQKEQEVKAMEDTTKTDEADAKGEAKAEAKVDPKTPVTSEPTTTTPEKEEPLVLTQSVPEVSSAPPSSAPSQAIVKPSGVTEPEHVLSAERSCTVRADGGVNLRSGPGTSNALIILIPDGKTVLQLGYDSTGTWVYAKYKENIGWISKEFLRGAE